MLNGVAPQAGHSLNGSMAHSRRNARKLTDGAPHGQPVIGASSVRSTRFRLTSQSCAA